MNEIVTKFLLAGDKCIPEKHLRQPGFTYSACGPFTKKQRKNTKIYRNRRFKIYLTERARESLFSTWHNLWGF